LKPTRQLEPRTRLVTRAFRFAVLAGVPLACGEDPPRPAAASPASGSAAVPLAPAPSPSRPRLDAASRLDLGVVERGDTVRADVELRVAGAAALPLASLDPRCSCLALRLFTAPRAGDRVLLREVRPREPLVGVAVAPGAPLWLEISLASAGRPSGPFSAQVAVEPADRSIAPHVIEVVAQLRPAFAIEPPRIAVDPVTTERHAIDLVLRAEGRAVGFVALEGAPAWLLVDAGSPAGGDRVKLAIDAAALPAHGEAIAYPRVVATVGGLRREETLEVAARRGEPFLVDSGDPTDRSRVDFGTLARDVRAVRTVTLSPAPGVGTAPRQLRVAAARIVEDAARAAFEVEVEVDPDGADPDGAIRVRVTLATNALPAPARLLRATLEVEVQREDGGEAGPAAGGSPLRTSRIPLLARIRS
jgi:hypothetical protein